MPAIPDSNLKFVRVAQFPFVTEQADPGTYNVQFALSGVTPGDAVFVNRLPYSGKETALVIAYAYCETAGQINIVYTTASDDQSFSETWIACVIRAENTTTITQPGGTATYTIPVATSLGGP